MALTAKELTNELTNYVNTFTADHDAFIKAFCSEHRTLQQSSFRMMLKLIEHMASDDYRTDARNDQSKVIAKKLIAGFKNEVGSDFPSQFLGSI